MNSLPCFLSICASVCACVAGCVQVWLCYELRTQSRSQKENNRKIGFGWITCFNFGTFLPGKPVATAFGFLQILQQHSCLDRLCPNGVSASSTDTLAILGPHRHNSKTSKCAVCEQPTQGIFNVAHEINKKMKKAKSWFHFFMMIRFKCLIDTSGYKLMTMAWLTQQREELGVEKRVGKRGRKRKSRACTTTTGDTAHWENKRIYHGGRVLQVASREGGYKRQEKKTYVNTPAPRKS